jgi:hypothetical protein
MARRPCRFPVRTDRRRPPPVPKSIYIPNDLGFCPGSTPTRHHRDADCRLPGGGWGRIDLAASAAPAGKDWTDDGAARQARGLKHRPQHETRSIPIPPILVQMLRNHLKRYGTAPDGRIFFTARGGLIQDSAYSVVGQEARAAALPPGPSKPPRSPSGLRPAARGRVAGTEGRRARHRSRPPRRAQRRRPAQGLPPCTGGLADTVNKRIADALGSEDNEDGQDELG